MGYSERERQSNARVHSIASHALSACLAVSNFKAVPEEVGIPHQSLINLYLRDCAASGRKLSLNWK